MATELTNRGGVIGQADVTVNRICDAETGDQLTFEPEIPFRAALDRLTRYQQARFANGHVHPLDPAFDPDKRWEEE